MPLFRSDVSGYKVKDTFIPLINGQTNFTLSELSSENVQPLLTVNGIEQERNVDYTLTSGNQLSWLNNPFELQTTDLLEIYYS